MILLYLKNFKNSIEESGELQLDFLLCQLLHKTPEEIRDLEKNGKLPYRQKCFLQAGILWSLEKGLGGCPFR